MNDLDTGWVQAADRNASNAMKIIFFMVFVVNSYIINANKELK
jgi:hypothetical protein